MGSDQHEINNTKQARLYDGECIDLFTASELSTKLAFNVSQSNNTSTGHQIDLFKKKKM